MQPAQELVPCPLSTPSSLPALLQVLQGNQLIDSQLGLQFRTEVQKKSICGDTLNEKQVQVFTKAVRDHYW